MSNSELHEHYHRVNLSLAQGKKQHMSDIRQLTGCHNTRNQSGFDMEESATVLLSGKALIKKRKQEDKMTGEALAKFVRFSGFSE